MFGYFLNRSVPVLVSFYVSVCKSLLRKTQRLSFVLSLVSFTYFRLPPTTFTAQYCTVLHFPSNLFFLKSFTIIRAQEEWFPVLRCTFFHKAEQAHIAITRTISSSFQQIIQYIIRQWELQGVYKLFSPLRHIFLGYKMNNIPTSQPATLVSHFEHICFNIFLHHTHSRQTNNAVLTRTLWKIFSHLISAHRLLWKCRRLVLSFYLFLEIYRQQVSKHYTIFT